MNQFFGSHFLLYILVLFIYTAVSHGLVLLNNGLYWDGWMVDSWQRRKDWRTMKKYLSEVGMPIMYYVYRLNAFFPNRIFASKFLAFVSTYISSVQIYLIATYFNFLNPEQALVLSLLYLSYTGYHMLVDTVVGLQYTFPTAVFYTAVFLSLYAHSQNGSVALFAHIAAILLFFWSFNANSILVYYFGYLGLSLFLQVNGHISNILDFNIILNNLIYGLIPFIFWILKEKYSPRHGYCAEYNKIRFSIVPLVIGLFHSVQYALESAIIKPVLFIINDRFISVPVTSVIIFIIIRGNNLFAINLNIANNESVMMIGIGFLLFVLASAPYSLVGQAIEDNGWGTKNAMLIHLPSALIIFGLLNLCISDSKSLQIVLLIYLVITCIFNIRNYLYYLAVYVKDYSWLYKLKNIKKIEEIGIFQVIDNHLLKGDLCNISQDYRPAYLSFMFDWLWKSEVSRFGIREFAPRPAYSFQELSDAFENTTIPYVFTKIDTNSKQARIVINNGFKLSFYIIALKYIKAKYFSNNKRELTDILEGVTSIELEILD